MESPTGMIENGSQVSAAARQIGVCRDVGEIIPSPGGKGDREAVDEERRPLQITEPSHFFGIRPNVVP